MVVVGFIVQRILDGKGLEFLYIVYFNLVDWYIGIFEDCKKFIEECFGFLVKIGRAHV